MIGEFEGFIPGGFPADPAIFPKIANPGNGA